MNYHRPDQLDLEDDIAELDIHLCNKKRILIVEGKSDISFFKVLLTAVENDVVPFIAGKEAGENSREKIIQLFDEFNIIQNNEKILGVIDKDFNSNIPMKYNNLLQTEFYDLDCYYIFSDNFCVFFSELIYEEKVKSKLSFNATINVEQFKNFLIYTLTPLTKMRLKNNSLNIPFNKLLKKSPVKDRKDRHKKLAKFVNDDWVIDIEKFYKYLTDSGRNKGTSLQMIFNEITDFEIDDPTKVTNGHDLISLLTLIVKLNRNDYDDIRTEESLRLTMNIDSYDEFELTKRVKEWILLSEEYSLAVES